jgi:hypothetical protein
MTASELQSIVLRLSNSAFVRHWLHWNYPCETPWVMAIEVRDLDGGQGFQPKRVPHLEDLGFEWDEVDRRHYIDRDVKADGVDPSWRCPKCGGWAAGLDGTKDTIHCHSDVNGKPDSMDQLEFERYMATGKYAPVVKRCGWKGKAT